jgi:hypothetical protein
MIETVRIVKDNGRTGYATINKSDFDPARHELFEAEADSGGWTVRKLRARLAELDITVPRSATSKDALLALLPEDER